MKGNYDGNNNSNNNSEDIVLELAKIDTNHITQPKAPTVTNDAQNNRGEGDGSFNGNESGRVAEIVVEGQKIEINYKDLMTIIKLKQNDEKEKQKTENAVSIDGEAEL